MEQTHCSVCGKDVSLKVEWEGTCVEEGCDKLICKDCWKKGIVKCLDHQGKAEEKQEEPRSPDDEERIRGDTLGYMNFLRERISHRKPIDWTVSEYLPKTKCKVSKKDYGEFEIDVFRKGFIFKKKRIRILVRPLVVFGGFQRYINEVMENLKNLYTIIVFVGDITSKIEKLIESFSNDNISIYIYDTDKKDLIFNRKNAVTGKYSSWFDPEEKPKNFFEIVYDISEDVAGKKVVTIEMLLKEFGIEADVIMKILKRKEFVRIEGTNSYMLKMQ
jgi:hypothetical protein